MNLKEKKGYHVFMAMDVMKAFKKVCTDESVPVGHAIETLILRELEYRRGINRDVVADMPETISLPEEASQIVV